MRYPFIAACFLIGNLGVLAYASDYGTGLDTTSSVTPSASVKISGMAQSVDVSADTIKIKDATDHVRTVKVNQKTGISRGGKTVGLSDIRSGDILTIINPAN